MAAAATEPLSEGKAVPNRFEEAFAPLFGVAYRVAYRLLGDRQTAEDIAQETMARAFRHWGKLTRHPVPEAWISRVSSNQAVDAWHRRRRQSVTGGVEPAPPTESDDRVIQRVELHDVLARLSRRQREVLVLRFVGDLSESDVAAFLGCSVGAVKQHAARGLERLRTPQPANRSKED